MLELTVQKTSGHARLGRLKTDHGDIATPAFMPVGTAGSVKGLTPQQLRDTGTEMILANTYHLMLRPGDTCVETLGGLHRIMAWDGPILTDSGGYQVFSLAHLRTLDEEGVTFQSHIDGAEVRLTPERAVEIQHRLGADVMMQLDECPPGQASREEVLAAVERSTAWARRCREAWQGYEARSAQGHGQALFGIQQGGTYRDLRAESARQLVALDLPGYAVGGLSVGEGHEAMCDVLQDIPDLLPADRPRYLMGVGEPRDILAAVGYGIDMFDCVLPTRNGRNAQAFTWGGRLRLRNACHTEETRPIDEACTCYACRNYSRGVIRHLFMAKEMLGPTLVSLHNLHFFADFMAAIRDAITADTFHTQRTRWLEELYRDAP